MKKLFISMLIAVLPFCSSVKDALAANDPTLITTVNGPIKGTEEGDLLAWRGLPYAKPPVGNLRWMPPQPPEKWKELLITGNAANLLI
ncbi:carboxylesterase family protein [Klebsiella quasipneumoniae]|uniref:carboxylesterase family protein n=1 Tax=Klebsiella quasipneumoniae TaxID=1463165 RepID=UPI001119419F|nr:carboxylesterase family protein [Klebsiella quasipneumoniae]